MKNSLMEWNFRFYITLRRWGARLLKFTLIRNFASLFLVPHAEKVTGDLNEIEQLDQIMDSAKSLDHFLANQELQDHYFKVASTFFGKRKFNRGSFNAILEQIKTTVEVLPELKNRLWSHTDPNHRFQISSFSMTSGRVLNPTLWKLRRSLWLSELRAQCGVGLNNDELPQIELEIEKKMEAVSSEIKEFRERLQSVSPPLRKKAMIEETGRFYHKLSQDPRLKQAAAYSILKFLVNNQMNYFLEIDNADLILDFFRDLKQFPSKLLHTPNVPNMPNMPNMPNLKDVPLLSQIKALIPDIKSLLADERLFQPQGSLSQQPLLSLKSQREIHFETRRIRPFHAVWVGITMNDCLGGAVENLHKLSPRRWAIGCLNGAQNYLFTQNSRFAGFTKLIPVQSPSGKIYGSFGVAIPMIGRNILPQGETGKEVPARNLVLFDVWLPLFLDFVPKSWNGLVASESIVCDLSQTKYTIWNSPHLYASEDLGHSSEFAINDPLAQKIVDLDANPEVNKYGKGMILDALVVDAGNLRRIEPFTNSRPHDLNHANISLDQKKRILNYSAYLDRKTRPLSEAA